MLRMGRSPKVDASEAQPPNTNQPPNVSQPQPPRPTQAQAQPAAQVFEPPARPAQPAASAAPSAPRAVTESEALARDLRDGVVSGFVGGGTVVSGDADFKGMLRIDGRFTGRVRSEKGALIVSAGGVVDANIEVATARINGTVNGDIVATERIELGRAARVHGQIQTPALVIEDGAIFEGACSMRRPEAAPSIKATNTAESRPANNPAQSKVAHARPAQTATTQGAQMEAATQRA